MNFDLQDFEPFTYAMRSHWVLFDQLDQELYGHRIDMDKADLKKYQDLFVTAFIKQFTAPSARILDVGGGLSRVLRYFSETHECWNVDRR